MATAPNQLWSWDITYLATTVKGLYFYLYLIVDLFSRKIVDWEVFAEESAEHAATVFRKAYLREGVAGQLLRLHSDNGSPMKGDHAGNPAETRRRPLLQSPLGQQR